jgi:G:T-mismatch repair DNA endonuclease (very short patch repair protein)
MPEPKDPQTSARMRRQRRVGTGPELALSAELRRRHFKVDTNVTDLPGRPDVVLRRRGVVVFFIVVSGMVVRSISRCPSTTDRGGRRRSLQTV